jgi:hypothetical protein
MADFMVLPKWIQDILMRRDLSVGEIGSRLQHGAQEKRDAWLLSRGRRYRESLYSEEHLNGLRRKFERESSAVMARPAKERL